MHCARPGLQTRAVTRRVGKGSDMQVIEGIPAISCPHCGESWFTAQTMHEIERIKRLPKLAAAGEVEIKRRLEQVANGTAKLRAADEVHRQARRLYR